MSRTANDDRSDSMNPNNDAYDDAMDNHADQLNPNNDEYQGLIKKIRLFLKQVGFHKPPNKSFYLTADASGNFWRYEF